MPFMGENGDIPRNTSKFFPVVEMTRNDLVFHRKKLKCIDQDKINIYGNYNADKAN